MSEKIAYKTLKEKVFDRTKDRIDRIEAGVDGIPDTNFCIGGKEGWIEIKAPTEPKRATTKLFASNHKISKDQENWFIRQVKAKGRAFILVSTDKRWMLFLPSAVQILNDMTVEQMQFLAIWETHKPVRDKELWNKLRQILSK
jgi:hypothetical protein